MKDRRTAKDKLKTLLFGKDLRITKGDPYTEERPFDYTSYYPVEQYIRAQECPTERVFSITDYGAIPEDTGVDNATAINACIAACAAQGGGVVIVSGGAFTTRTVVLQSGVTLFISAGSMLIAHESGDGFDHRALIYANGCTKIGITGGGTVHGNGHLFGRKPLLEQNITQPAEVIDVIQMRRDYRAQLRFAHPSKYGRLVVFEDCRDIHIDNIIFKDSAHWTLRATRCTSLVVENTVIHNNRHVCNTDGIDLMQTSNAEIRHCFLSCADDGIVLKNAVWEGCDSAMRDIHITDCEIISCTNAFKIGTETTFPISHVTVERCRFFMTDLYPGSVSGISIESVDGSEVHDITVRDITMERCTCPVFLRLGNRNRAAKVNAQSASAIEFGVKAQGKGMAKTRFDGKGELYDILIENITATDIELPVIIAGYREKGTTKRIRNVTLRNLALTYRNAREVYDRRRFIPEYAKEYPECWRFRNLPAYALWARHVQGLTVERFTCRPAQATWKKERILEDVLP